LVDLEAHVAPGLDDGAASRETALEMCRLAARTGTREMVVAVRTKLDQPFDRDELESAVKGLQAELGDSLFLHSSCVVQLTWANAPRVFREPERYAVNGLRYLPFEITGEMLARGGIGKVFGRYRDAGLLPVIARPERTGSLRSDLSRLRHWVDRGSLIQVTAGSLIGAYGERAQLASIQIIDANLAHFVASCGRSLGGRSPVLDEAYEMVVYRWGEKTAQRLFIDNPWAALWGEDVEAVRPRLRRAKAFLHMLGLRGRSRRRRRRRA
jgi:protein-tyrosine phosphatase